MRWDDMRNDKGLVKKKELKLWKSFSPPTSQCDTQHLIDVGHRERKVVEEREENFDVRRECYSILGLKIRS